MISDQTVTLLADEIVAYIKSRRDKKEEVFLKDKPKKNKKGKVTNGAINTRLLGVLKNHIEDKDAISAIEKVKKSKEQSAPAFQIDKYEKLLSLFGEDTIDGDWTDIKAEYQQFKVASQQEHEPVTWLTQWAEKAKDISFATHVGKLTHSSSKSSSVLDVSMEKDHRYLTTSTLVNPEIDTAASNAASLPIADILKIAVGGHSVLDCLKNNDLRVFEQLTSNKTLVETWVKQLKQAYDSSTKQSYFLSKQAYFPLTDGSYHLLLPLKSSSLIHALHLEHKKYFDDEQKQCNEQRRHKKYSPIIQSSYPRKATLHVTGSNHSNASSLNGKRGGVITLLRCAPSEWKGNAVSYVKKDSLFDKNLRFTLSEEITELKEYLLVLKSKTLSTSEPKRNSTVRKKLKAISDGLFDHIVLINRQEACEGWTRESDLPIEQQLLFEPWRNDDEAKREKLSNGWQGALSQSYGRWLNKQLQHKTKLQLSPIHERLWADVFAYELREFVAVQEVAL